ncbi:hypothetical protein ACVI53_002407 [Bradyrhizobium barranii subsp. barranii]
MRLGEVLDRNALVAGERRQQDLHLVLLDQLAHGAHRGIRCRVGRSDDEFKLFVADLLTEHIERRLVTAHAVLAEHGVGAFQRCRDADLDLFLGDCRA